MYVNDFDLNGSIEQIICAYNGEKSYPLVMKDDLIKQVPSLSIKYKKYDDYKDQTVEDIFPADILLKTVRLNAKLMESIVLINSGNGSFTITPLPVEAQFSPVYAIIADDFNKDGTCDLILGGNNYKTKPESGIYDASYGLFLKGLSNGKFESVSSVNSGLLIKGAVRDIEMININGKPIIGVALNNDKLQLYKY